MHRKVLVILTISLLLLSIALAQDQPGQNRFPGALNSAASLIETADNARTVLKSSLSASATSMTVASTAAFPATGLLMIDSRSVVAYTGKTSTTFTGLVWSLFGTPALTFAAGVTVEMRVLAAEHNTLSTALRAHEAKIGYGASTPSSGKFFKGTGSSTSAWQTMTQSDVTTALGFTPADSTGIITLEQYGGAVGGSNASAALASAITAADAAGSPIILKDGVYGLQSPIPGTAKNITFISYSGKTVFKKLPGSGVNALISTDYGTFEGWRFVGIEFDGNFRNSTVAGEAGGATWNLSGLDGLTFEWCKFRDHTYHAAASQMCRNLQFRHCKWFGTVPGVMQAGVQDPPAVSTAQLRSGTQAGGGENIVFDDCEFHFCTQGIVTTGNDAAYGDATQDSVRGLRITNCRFRGDWFNNPYKIGEWTVSAQVGTFYSDNVYLDISSGSFAGFFDNFNTVCFPVQVTTGSAFTSVYADFIQATGIGTNASVGDVIETADGRRAEVVQAVNNNQVDVRNWESLDTFEPTDAPALNTAWRLRRYYATTCYARIGNTRIQLYQEPVNLFTGHKILTDDGITLTGRSFRTFYKTGYSGTHINHTSDALVEGNWYRGSWADQASAFDNRQYRLVSNHIEYGEDQAITVTNCPGAVVEGNTVRNQGAGIFVGSDGASVHNNSVYNWNLHYAFDGLGAIQLVGLNMSVGGNVFGRDPSLSYPGFSGYCFSMFLGDMTGTVISNNTGTGRVGQVYLDNNIVSVTVRDMEAAGPGVGLVKAFGYTATLIGGGGASGIITLKPTDNGTPATDQTEPKTILDPLHVGALFIGQSSYAQNNERVGISEVFRTFDTNIPIGLFSNFTASDATRTAPNPHFGYLFKTTAAWTGSGNGIIGVQTLADLVSGATASAQVESLRARINIASGATAQNPIHLHIIDAEGSGTITGTHYGLVIDALRNGDGASYAIRQDGASNLNLLAGYVVVGGGGAWSKLNANTNITLNAAGIYLAQQNLAASGTINLIGLNGSDQISIAPSGQSSVLGGAATVNGLLTIQGTANTGVFASTGYSLTGSNATNAVNLAGTWNTSGSPIFLGLAITDTASGSSALAMQILGGSSASTNLFSVSKAGNVAVGGTLAVGGTGSLFKGADVASAATITITGNVFHVTGTTNITSVSGTGVAAGTTITIIFDGALTFTDGSNLKLAGNFVTTADDTITLSYEGSNWYEVARSVN